MNAPKVSVVLPVYNGENYVREAIESVLTQTYRDFEFLIVDNASTDATERICTAYAVNDSRICCHRHAKNWGASMNRILGFRMASADYIKLIAHDDVWAPTLLEKCVQVLDEHPEVILAYPKTRLIDENGDTIEDFDSKLDFSSERARDRIRSSVWGRHRAYPIFGLARSSAMAKTKNLQPFVDSDRVWLARLALQGPFKEIPEYLFYSRMHDRRYGSLAARPSVQLAWFDPANGESWGFQRRGFTSSTCERSPRQTWAPSRRSCVFISLRRAFESAGGGANSKMISADYSVRSFVFRPRSVIARLVDQDLVGMSASSGR